MKQKIFILITLIVLTISCAPTKQCTNQYPSRVKRGVYIFNKEIYTFKPKMK